MSVRLLALVLFASMFQDATAIDSTICCLKAARAVYTKDSKLLPWESCAFGANYVEGTYKRGETPEVTTTVAFCKENCPGVRLSNLEQWLLLLTSWVLPAVALLIICSTGESKEKKEKIVDTPTRANPGPLFKLAQFLNFVANAIYRIVPNIIMEFAAILGDPSSAIRGAFSEIALDVRVVHSLYLQEGFDMMMRALAMVAGQTKFDEDVKIKLVNTLVAKGLLIATDLSKLEAKTAALRKCLLVLEQKPGSLLLHDLSSLVERRTFPENDPRRYETSRALRWALVCPEKDRSNALTTCLQALLESLHRDAVKRSEIVLGSGYSVPQVDPEKGQGVAEVSESKTDIQLHEGLQRAIEAILGSETERRATATEPILSIQEVNTENEIEYADKGGVGVVTEGTLAEDEKKELHTPFEKSDWAKNLKHGIKMSIDGRVDFMKALVVPVILSLVATAGSFYNAYTELGDNDTAHSLAYGVWFSWIIILAVASNCYIATANPGLPKLALSNQVYLSEITVPLRERAHNTRKWSQWLADIGCAELDAPAPTPSTPHRLLSRLKKLKKLIPARARTFMGASSALLERTVTTVNFALHLLFKQLLGWLCIGFTCSCAATISYTTPTVGLGCRSFNHMLYGICTLAVAAIAVYREFLTPRNHWTAFVFARAIYIFGICLNVFILVGGTLFHLIGLYRTCLCSVLGAKADFLLYVSSNTALAVGNAKKFWLPIGYVDFGFVWIICCIAVACRGYIHYHIKMFRSRLDKKIKDD